MKHRSSLFKEKKKSKFSSCFMYVGCAERKKEGEAREDEQKLFYLMVNFSFQQAMKIMHLH